MKRIRFPLPCRHARLILQIELPLTVIFAVTFLISYLICFEVSPAVANLYYPPLMIYLFYPFVITSFSVLLIERLSPPKK